MSFKNSLNSNGGSNRPFADKKSLAENDVVFCITSARDAIVDDKKAGKVKRWFLDIQYLDNGDVVQEVLTLDSTPQRDTQMQELQADLSDADAVHNVMLQKITPKRGNPFYIFANGDEQEVCACDIEPSTTF